MKDIKKDTKTLINNTFFSEACLSIMPLLLPCVLGSVVVVIIW